MAKTGAPQRDMTAIGEVANPPFIRLPDPEQLFKIRAERFRFLARDHELGPYLSFLAGLSEGQHRAQANLPEPTMPTEETLARAREFEMPPLDRAGFLPDAAFDATLRNLLGLAAESAMPEAAGAALRRLGAEDRSGKADLVRSVLANAPLMERLAESSFIAAALQIHFARLASRLEASKLVPVGEGACPVCGNPPASSMVVGWQGAHGTRYCGCGLCGTLWNYVRIKCTLCGTTKGISYKEIEGRSNVVKAETCTACRAYVKILHQHEDGLVDIIADDVASLGLDLLMRDAGFHRGGVDPFLWGY